VRFCCATSGVAVEQDSIHINLQNPASFANLKTTFLGGTYNDDIKIRYKSEMPQEQR
jgi:hypothetical protein